MSDTVAGNPARGWGWTGWALRSLAAQAILGCYDSLRLQFRGTVHFEKKNVRIFNTWLFFFSKTNILLGVSRLFSGRWKPYSSNCKASERPFIHHWLIHHCTTLSDRSAHRFWKSDSCRSLAFTEPYMGAQLSAGSLPTFPLGQSLSAAFCFAISITHLPNLCFPFHLSPLNIRLIKPCPSESTVLPSMGIQCGWHISQH